MQEKTTTTAANALFNNILGFPNVLQSYRGGKWLNALLQCITQLLSATSVQTSDFYFHLRQSRHLIFTFSYVSQDI